MRTLRRVVAFWYLAVSTNTVAVVFDWVAPQTKTIVSLDYPCARHDCGCRTAEQCRLHCCCVHTASHAPVRQVSLNDHPASNASSCVRVSRLSVAVCHGHDSNGGLPSDDRLDPHLPLVNLSLLAANTVYALPRVEPARPHSILKAPPEKVPLVLSS